MVTASHNPPSDNAVKVYWSTGGQILPPHDKGIIERVMNTQEIRRADFDEMLAAGKIVLCQDEMDAKFQQAVLTQATPGPRELKVIYSPLHGVGATAVVPVLAADGFTDVEVFGPHAKPDGDFPNVPGHVAESREPAGVRRDHRAGQAKRAPIWCWRPIRTATASAARRRSRSPRTRRWHTLTGNQLGALLADYVLENRKCGRPAHAAALHRQTLVTTQLVRRIGDSYGVRTIGDLLVGFKWIAGAIDEFGPELFVFGTEESHGYMAGSYVRDKDGAVASLLLCELAAKLKAAGQTLHEKLDALFWQHGVHAERTVSVQMPGSEGMARMQEVMAAFRAGPPAEIGGDRVAQIRDYERQTVTPAGGKPQPLAGPKGDLVFLDLATRRQLRRLPPQRHGAEDQVLHVRLHAAGAAGESRSRQSRARTSGSIAMEADLRKFAGV